MKVRTLKDHANEYGVRDGTAPYEKKGSSNVIYEIDDEAAAKALIADGAVEKVKDDAGSEDRGPARTGSGSK
jgi:hypothetical protein